MPCKSDTTRDVYRLLNAVLSPGEGAPATVMIFHRVLPHPDELRPSEPDTIRFEQVMRWVRAWFSVVPLQSIAAARTAQDLPPRSLAITFDDGYADNYTLALPILQKLGLSATFFVAPGFLNGGRMFNDTVIETIRQASGPQLDLTELGLESYPIGSVHERLATIDKLLRKLKYFPLEQRAERVAAIARQVGAKLPDDLMMSDAQVVAMRRAGMGIGAHTMSHPILASVDDSVAHAEIVASKRHLESMLGEPVDLFAYPNGRPTHDYAIAHVKMARDAGFKAAVSTAAGVFRPGADPFQIPRFTPWDRSRLKFALRFALNARQPGYEHV